ncbi:hypothetical protein H8B13_10305 [Hymenobacter sp. BT188]|uniref:hypothetical protein n=1 Tax=Hymenobacter sp. BT188 TaxID=2763504 RepID=UPI001651009B|nr:hypothetical protein [Hymenobacter sp. BT188]MBC6607211.1 hypothetical protein [Hymenobacter sp. BT188]
MEVTLTNITKIDKPPYIETIMGGLTDYKRIAPIFAFYNVELQIAGEKLLLETEIRDSGRGLGVQWDSDQFINLLDSHLKIQGINKVYDLVSENVWLIYTNEKVDLPISLTLDAVDIKK